MYVHTYIYYLQCALRKVIICTFYIPMYVYVFIPVYYKCKFNADKDSVIN